MGAAKVRAAGLLWTTQAGLVSYPGRGVAVRLRVEITNPGVAGRHLLYQPVRLVARYGTLANGRPVWNPGEMGEGSQRPEDEAGTGPEVVELPAGATIAFERTFPPPQSRDPLNPPLQQGRTLKIRVHALPPPGEAQQKWLDLATVTVTLPEGSPPVVRIQPR